MKRLNQSNQPLLLLFSLWLCLMACKKPVDPITPEPGKPTISSVDPATAPVGSTIAINGTNFDPSLTGNTVTIGGVTATVVSVTPTRIVVTVPVGAVAGPISVTAGGQSVQSPIVFTPGSAPTVPAGSKPIAMKRGTIFQNQTWSRDSIYMLDGMVYIPENYTLTIAAGTTIKGAGANSALVIERIGRLVATGTAAQPIVFTSAKPVGQRSAGDWGGLVLEGKSPVNRPGVTPYPNGIRGTVAAYGEPLDNSGTLQYVRIEYAGAPQATTPATRLAGLTMIGVGSGTTIDHVQVSYSAGDAFSWFGGSVNAKNLYAYRNVNDDWSTDWGYVGNVQFGVALRDPEVADQSGSNGFEVENYEPGVGTDVPVVVLRDGLQQTAPTFANISNFAFGTTPSAANTSRGTGPYKAAIRLRRASAINIYNSLFYGYPEGLNVESAGAASGLSNGTIDLRGVVLANVLTPIVGGGTVTTDQATAYFNTGRNNEVITSSNLATLLFNASNFALSAPNFLPQPGSPLLAGAVTGGKVVGPFLMPVAYRGAFGTDNWLAGWTNVNPQNADYDRTSN